MYLWEQGSYCEIYRELWIDYDMKSQESKMLNHANCRQTFLENQFMTFFKNFGQ